jgi:hypothetical protein
MARIKNSLLSALRMREEINRYLESLGEKHHDPSADRAIVIALAIIGGLLFFAALILGSYLALSGARP